MALNLDRDNKIRSAYGLGSIPLGAVARKIQRRIDPLGYVAFSYRRMGTTVRYSLLDRVRYAWLVWRSDVPVQPPNGGD